MAVQVKFNDNSKVVLKTLEGNIPAALNAMGITAVNLIAHQMQDGYGKPIRQTGDLMRDVQYEVDEQGQKTRVGNTLEYGPYVHDGTYKMAGRPYVRDGLTGGEAARKLKQSAEPHISRGF